MGPPRLAHLLAAASVLATAVTPARLTASTHHNVAYLTRGSTVEQAIERYLDALEVSGHHDHEALQQLALAIIKSGIQSRTPEENMLAVFGAGVSLHSEALALLESAFESTVPQVQLAALNFMVQLQDDRAFAACLKALGSPFLIVRLEAVHALAVMRHPDATTHIDSLMMKVDDRVQFLFPQLFALQGDATATLKLRQMLNHHSLQVRVAAILSAAQHGRDDLLPDLRILANQLQPTQQEACAIALGRLGDSASRERLYSIANNGAAGASIAAMQALYRIGDTSAGDQLEKVAAHGHLLAIAALSEVAGSDETLAFLTRSNDPQISINAAVALLDRGDTRAVEALLPILISDERDLAITPSSSSSGGMQVWKLTPSARHNFAELPMAVEISTRIREGLVSKIAALSAPVFLATAEKILAAGQSDLVPVVVSELERLNTAEAVCILQHNRSKLGAPLVRHYCDLALYRLHEGGVSANKIRESAISECHRQMIAFRPVLPWEVHQDENPHEMTPTESSRLLIETFEALARQQDSDGIVALLEAMRDGHPHNRYALAGLLIRAAS